MYFASGENKFISFNDCIRKVANVNRDGEMNKKKKRKRKTESYFGTYQSCPYKVLCCSAISYYIYINVVQCTRSTLVQQCSLCKIGTFSRITFLSEDVSRYSVTRVSVSSRNSPTSNIEYLATKYSSSSSNSNTSNITRKSAKIGTFATIFQ